jgi:hypothetical protein
VARAIGSRSWKTVGVTQQFWVSVGSEMRRRQVGLVGAVEDCCHEIYSACRNASPTPFPVVAVVQPFSHSTGAPPTVAAATPAPPPQPVCANFNINGSVDYNVLQPATTAVIAGCGLVGTGVGVAAPPKAGAYGHSRKMKTEDRR